MDRVESEPRKRFLTFGSPLVTEREIAAVTDVLRSRWIGTGPKVAEFEEAFRAYLDCRHTVACSSCTAALHLAMLVAGVGPGDEVITTPMTFCATANAIIHTGATPVFVDIDPETLNLDPALLERAITDRTKAILPVHFAGRPCEMDAIMDLARNHGLLVIEDAAHAIEAVYRGRKVGTIGDITCFSFYVTKNIYTGEGGMIATADAGLADAVKTCGLHGMTRDAWQRHSDKGYRHYGVVRPGYKYNMMDIQAAMGLAQMPFLERYHARRCQVWRVYDEAFRDLPFTCPADEPADCVHARHLYTILLDLDRLRCTRDEFMDSLYKRKIGTGVHYVSLHLQPYYRDRFGFKPDDFPQAARVSERTVSLPLSPALTDPDVRDVIDAVVRSARQHAR